MNESLYKYKDLGFVRAAAAVPKLKVGDPVFNTKEIYDLIMEAFHKGVGIVVFPELCITGYSCGDLFSHRSLISSAFEALKGLLDKTADIPVLFAVGIPYVYSDNLYDCAVIAYKGKLLGIVPKKYLPNKGEFYEKRWFHSSDFKTPVCISFLGQETYIGNFLIKIPDSNIVLGIEICEDLWAVSPPSNDMVLSGANIILNLSASNEVVSKASYRKDLVVMQSAKGICAYVYASAGVHESTTDTVFSGDAIIAENGRIFGRSERFSRDSSLIMADIDMNKLSHDRMLTSSFSDSMDTLPPEKKYTCISLDLELNWPDEKDRLHRYISPHPFVPSSKERRDIHCNEIFNIQTAALAKRLEHTGIRKVYIGISGGLDSTLALLAAHRTFKLLGFPAEDITGVTMPGFGTTERTNTNAKKLMKELNISSLEIDITRACLDHFKNIGHDPDIHDTTYENVQARERTQILMDLANKYDALVIGTGDLSELALGWCTYNGDHMSMYSINSGIPKTLVRHLIEWVAQAKESDNAEYILEDILATPISPELLPGSSEGKITQKTEDILGPYELHDFFLYYFLRQGAGPDKLKFLASHAFKDEYTQEEIQKWLKVFVSRFFSQQFKRSCIPDGPKVGSVSLSPRGDWKMPSDMSSAVWSVDI